jgi:hypothetical protein
MTARLMDCPIILDNHIVRRMSLVMDHPCIIQNFVDSTGPSVMLSHVISESVVYTDATAEIGAYPRGQIIAARIAPIDPAENTIVNTIPK